MNTTSGSLSLLSATNLWCFGDVEKGESAARQAPATPSQPSVSPSARALPGRPGSSLTRDIQRPSPCTSCTGAGLLAGFSALMSAALQL